ncbi:MAG TPA: hypothetical protein VF797_21640 [Noviherbaspirillum sp.]
MTQQKTTTKTITHKGQQYSVTTVSDGIQTDVAVRQGEKVLGTIYTRKFSKNVLAFLPGAQTPANKLDSTCGTKTGRINALTLWILDQPAPSPMEATLVQIATKHFGRGADAVMLAALAEAYAAGKAAQ